MNTKFVNIRGEYEFDVDENGFPTFTEKNIKFLNAILRYDSNYSTSIETESLEYDQNYAGILERTKERFFVFPTERTYLGTKLGSGKRNSEADEDGYEKDDLYRVIETIDKINSTHLASEGPNGGNRGRINTVNKIRKINDLKERLKEKDPELVYEIAEMGGGKTNFSFATKFCSYVCRHALDVDNYCIYDEVVQSVLPYYAYMYIDGNEYKKLYKRVSGKNARNKSTVYKFKEEKDYEGYRDIIDKIIRGIYEKVGTKVTYSEFDHMLWYYFKGLKSKTEKAMQCLDGEKQ